MAGEISFRDLARHMGSKSMPRASFPFIRLVQSSLTAKVICPLSVLLEKESRRVSVIQGGQGVGEAVGVHKRLDVLVQQGATIGGRVLQLSVAGVDGHPDARRRTEEDGVQAALVQHRQVCCVLQSVQQAQHEGVVRQLGISCRARRLAAVTWGLDEAPHR